MSAIPPPGLLIQKFHLRYTRRAGTSFEVNDDIAVGTRESRSRTGFKFCFVPS